MANHEERAARALAIWLRSGRDDAALEKALVQQLEEALYWERYQLHERIDALVRRYIGAAGASPAVRNAALELLGDLKSLLERRQNRDDARARLMPDWRADGGKRVRIPELNRGARPWPGPALPSHEQPREASLWEEASHVRDAPGTWASRKKQLGA